MGASSRVLSAAAVGLGLAAAAIGVVTVPGMVPWSVVIGVVVGGGIGLGALEMAKAASPGSTRACRDLGMVAGVAAAALCAVIAGLVSLLGAASGSVILFLALAALPWAWRELRRRDGVSAPRSTPDRPTQVPVVVADVPTAELCLAWRRSYLALLDLPPGPARDCVVRLRRELLDELELRDRAGFDRWIDAGARAGSDPSRYLGTDR